MSDKMRKSISICFWIVLWQVMTWLVNNDLLLVGPIETVKALCVGMLRADFWMSLWMSLIRISAGFLLGVFLGILLAVLASASSMAEALLSPMVRLLKAVPVASFVVLFLIWWGSKNLSIAISFCVVFPIMYVNTLEGIHHTDKKLLEMAKLFGIPRWNKVFYIYRPSVRPFLDSGMKVAVGMCWKSGVAAEVIGISSLSIGGQLYMSKIYMDTAGVFGWTGVIILLSLLFERIVLAFWKYLMECQVVCKVAKVHGAEKGKEIHDLDKANTGEVLRLESVEKFYDEKHVLEYVNAVYSIGEEYLFDSPSGSGKSTLFRLLAGLEKPDKGKIIRNHEGISMVFQEDRLCEEYSALTNVAMITGSKSKAREGLLLLLKEEDLEKPCRELSGGMKRRVAIVRALLAEGEVLILDEPFTGLDEENQTKVRGLIQEQKVKRAILIASHI